MPEKLNSLSLQDLGFDEVFEKLRIKQDLGSFEIARIISEHKDRWIAMNPDGIFESELIGNLRYTAQQRSDFPSVGDWVAISPYDEDKALIHAIFPRKTQLERQAVGKTGEKQIIATNIDFVFIVQSVDRDFNINRIERYLTICHTARVIPIILINKIDLIGSQELDNLKAALNERIKDITVIYLSNETKKGLDEVLSQIQKGKTYCLLGSSGVGKSSLLNNLAGEQHMDTKEIGSGTNRGKHVTTHRELFILENGGMIIDNPGMREVGIADSGTGLDITFEMIKSLANDCKFNDCTHSSESGCAVIKAVENGEIDETSYENFLRMEREKTHYESTVAEKRKKDKAFGKMVRDVKRHKGM